MFELRYAKEVTLTPNEDGTFSMIVKYDLYDEKSEPLNKQALMKYPKVKMQLDVLSVGGDYGSVMIT